MSEKLFELLLRLYPDRFRSEYDDAMRQLFRDRLRTETGLPARLRLWMDLLRDLAISIPREHTRRAGLAISEPGVYRLSEEAIGKMVRLARIGRAEAAMVLGFMAIGFSVAWAGGAPLQRICAVYGVLLPLAGMIVRRQERMRRHGRGRYEENLRSWEITLDQERIYAKGGGGPAHSLHRTEIARLSENDLGLEIEAHDPGDSMWASSLMNGYQDLRTRLADWAPVERIPGGPMPNVSRGAILWIVEIFPAAIVVPSPYFAIPLAALTIVPLLFLARRFSALRIAWLSCVALTGLLIWKIASVLR